MFKDEKFVTTVRSLLSVLEDNERLKEYKQTQERQTKYIRVEYKDFDRPRRMRFKVKLVKYFETKIYKF